MKKQIETAEDKARYDAIKESWRPTLEEFGMYHRGMDAMCVLLLAGTIMKLKRELRPIGPPGAPEKPLTEWEKETVRNRVAEFWKGGRGNELSS